MSSSEAQTQRTAGGVAAGKNMGPRPGKAEPFRTAGGVAAGEEIWGTQAGKAQPVRTAGGVAAREEYGAPSAERQSLSARRAAEPRGGLAQSSFAEGVIWKAFLRTSNLLAVPC